MKDMNHWNATLANKLWIFLNLLLEVKYEQLFSTLLEGKIKRVEYMNGSKLSGAQRFFQSIDLKLKIEFHII